MGFVVRTYFVWGLAMVASIALSWVTQIWILIPLVAIISVVASFLQCNNCGHHAAADANGYGRPLTNVCAKCASSLEDVYPFSYARKKKRSKPSSQ
jgi:hypothetical protein